MLAMMVIVACAERTIRRATSRRRTPPWSRSFLMFNTATHRRGAAEPPAARRASTTRCCCGGRAPSMQSGAMGSMVMGAAVVLAAHAPKRAARRRRRAGARRPRRSSKAAAWAPASAAVSDDVRGRAISARLDRYEFTVTPEEQGERLDAWLARAGAALVALAAHAAASRRARSPSTAARCARRRARCAPASAWCCCAAPPVAVEDRPEDIPLAVALRGRAPHRHRQAGGHGRASGDVAPGGHAGQRAACITAAIARRRRRRAAAGDRAPARQGHLGRDGRGQGRADAGRRCRRSFTRTTRAHVPGARRGRGRRARHASRRCYGRDPRDRKKFSSEVASRQARGHALARASSGCRARRCVEVALETGRTHQIRVHLADHGCRSSAIRTYGRPPREPRLRAVARGARPAGAARARARLHASGDGRADALVDGAAAGHAGGARGAARAWRRRR